MYSIRTNTHEYQIISPAGRVVSTVRCADTATRLLAWYQSLPA